MTGPTIKTLSAVEPWTEYQLEDGTTLRFRFTAAAFRATGKVNDGIPEYCFSSHVHCETFPAKEQAQVIELHAVETSDEVA